MEEAIDVENEPQENPARAAESRGDKVSANCFDALFLSFSELSAPFQPNATPNFLCVIIFIRMAHACEFSDLLIYHNFVLFLQ